MPPSTAAGRIGPRETAGGAGVDVVYDIVGGPMTAASLEAVAPGGELVFAALGRYAIGAAELEAMINQNQSLRDFALLPALSADGLRASLSELLQLAAGGQLAVTQGGRYPLDQANEAHSSLEERRSTGKVVLIS